ncbi:hypothetical protein ABPG75_006341 [Micractinium tetrahymenae]
MAQEELSRGEKAAISRAVHGGGEVHFTEKHPEKAEAAEAYRQELEAKEHRGHKGHKGHKEEPAHHKRGELTQGEKSAVSRAVHAGKSVEELPFLQGHPQKLERARSFGEKVEKGQHE